MQNLAPVHLWAATPSRLAEAAVVTACFALVAFLLRGVDRSGALAGGMVCLALFVSRGPAAFATLVGLFVLTWLATRFGSFRKQQLGVAENREGRNAAQVLANLGVAALCSLLAAWSTGTRWLVAGVAALVEAAADTAASEFGQSGHRPVRLITNWGAVPSGTDGGVSLYGSIAGVLSGVLIVMVSIVAKMIPWRHGWVPAIAGIIGMLADSVLGATVQRRGWINNNGVNFLGTSIAAVSAYLLQN